MQKILAVDLGTTLIKCTLFDEAGHILSVERLPCHLKYSVPGWAEQNVSVWYEGVCGLIRTIGEAHGAGDIKAICISSQGISFVPVDEQLRPLADALSWLDVRGEAESREMSGLFPEAEWFRRTGKFLSAGYTLPKLLWLKKHAPAVLAKASKILLAMDYVNARMTGLSVTDHTMASGTMLYNVGQRTWDPSILSAVSLEPSLLPEILPSGTRIGSINEETMRRTGLSADTLVFNGGQDQKVAAFAAGIDDFHASLSLGTAGALEILVDNAAGQTLLPFFPYLLPDTTLVEGCISTTGAAIQWVKDTLCPDLSFDMMNQLAAAAAPASQTLRFYPHLNKPGTPHHRMECFGMIQGISLDVGRGELIRSLYEGLACEFRLNLEQAAQAGSRTRELLVFGGASKSHIFCQIISNVTGLPLRVYENSELCSVGAARLAAEGLGLDGRRFAEAAAGATLEYTPQAELAAQYNDYYSDYTALYQHSSSM